MYSPKHALDTDNPSSCFNSDSPKNDKPITFTILFNNNRTVTPQKIKIQFQGGFVAEEFTVSCLPEENENMFSFEAEDTNEMQEFEFDEEFTCSLLRLQFDNSTDFYGRITIYRIEVWGFEEN